MRRSPRLGFLALILFGVVHFTGGQEDQIEAKEGFTSSSLTSSPQKSQHNDDSNTTVTFVKATLGREASIHCIAENLVGQKTVSWVRYRDVSLIAVGKFVYISDERFKVLHEVNSSDWFLVIKSVTYKDEGIYECQVNSDPYKTFKFHLSVVEPRTEILGDQELFVDYASSLNLTCLVISPNPPAFVFWKLSEKLVDVSESHQSANGDGQNDAANVKLVFNQNWRPGVTVSSLIIQRVNKSHNGVFQCIPSNSEAKQIKVHVLKDDSKPAAIQTTNQKSSSSQPPNLFPSKLLLLNTLISVVLLRHFQLPPNNRWQH